MNQFNLSSRDMLLDISSMAQQLTCLMNKGKTYDELLNYLINKDYYYSEDSRILTLKAISEETVIEYNQVQKQIKQIYKDLFYSMEDEESIVFTYQAAKYSFGISGYNKEAYRYMELDSLPVIPRVGDSVEIPYFKSILGTRTFYVESVSHELGPKGQNIHISLEPGYYNAYWQFRKAKAKEEGELYWKDFIDLDDYELKKKLKVGRLR